MMFYLMPSLRFHSGSDEVYDALKGALKRGVKVRIVADLGCNTTSHANKLKALGAEVTYYTHGKLHAKLAIYDGLCRSSCATPQLL